MTAGSVMTATTRGCASRTGVRLAQARFFRATSHQGQERGTSEDTDRGNRQRLPKCQSTACLAQRVCSGSEAKLNREPHEPLG
jgi:IS30 family transposase